MSILARVAACAAAMALLAGSPVAGATAEQAGPAGVPAGAAAGGPELATPGRAVLARHPDLPVLPDEVDDAAAWLVADVGTGAVLAAKDAYAPLPPASTLKLLTALALLPLVPSDLAYAATEADARVEGSRVGLVPDETYSRADLEHGLVLGSGNDAAHALAGLAGGLGVALDLMNAEAFRLGAFTTRALTPHGLDEPGQVSSAYDLALIGRAALADDTVSRLATTRTYEFPALDGSTFQIQNHNRLLGRYDGSLGLKTGYATEAGHTLVGAAARDGTTLVVTVLGADGRAEPVAAALLDWAFAVPADAEPVGELITPEQAAAAVDAARVATPAGREDAGEASNGGTAGRGATDAPDGTDGAGTDDDATTGGGQAGGSGTFAGLPAGLVAGAFGTAAVVVLATLALRRRRPAGRYSA